MNLFNKTIILITYGILLPGLTSCTSLKNEEQEVKNTSTGIIHVEANRIVHKNLMDLKKNSDFIGIIQAVDSFQNRKHVNNYMPDGSLSDFYTITTIKVLKVFKGDIPPNSNIEIIEPISIINNGGEMVKITLDNYSELPFHKASLVFLQKNTFGQLGINNAQNSVFPLKKDDEGTNKKDLDRDEIYKGLINEKILEE